MSNLILETFQKIDFLIRGHLAGAISIFVSAIYKLKSAPPPLLPYTQSFEQGPESLGQKFRGLHALHFVFTWNLQIEQIDNLLQMIHSNYIIQGV